MILPLLLAVAAAGVPVTVHVTPGDVRGLVLHASRNGAERDFVDALPPGEWFVTAKAAGWWSDTVLVAVGEKPVETELRLHPGARVHARLMLPSGVKASGVAVYFRALDGSFSGSAACPINDCQLPVGVFDLAFRIPGLASAYRWETSIRAPDTDLGLLTFQRGSTVSGRVDFAERGAKRERAEVNFTPAASAGQNEELRARATVSRLFARANSRGYFSINLPPGEYLVQARSGNLVSEQRTVTVIEGRESELREPLLLEAMRTLTVNVAPPVDPWQKPWNVLVTRFDDHGAVLSERTAPVPQNGTCVFAEQLPGSYQVHVQRTPREVWHSEHVELRRDETINALVDITAVKGSITLGDEPLAAWLAFESNSGVRIPVRSTANGDFRAYVPRVIRDTWSRIEVSAPHLTRVLRDVRMTGGDDGTATLDLHLPATALNGTIVDEDGIPARFVLLNMTGPSGDFQQVRCDDGTFALKGLEAGRYRLSASTKEAQTDGTTEVELSEESRAVTLVVRQDTSLRGTVRSNVGPVIGASVFAFPSGHTPQVIAPIAADAAGKFALRLPRGTAEATVVAAAPGFAVRLMRMPLDREAEVEIALDQQGGSLSIETLPSDGPIPYLVHDGAALTVTGVAFVSDQGFAGSQAAGFRIQIPSMEPGTYSLCSTPDRCATGFLPRHGSLSLRTGQRPRSE